MGKWDLLVLYVGALSHAAFCSLPSPVDVVFSSLNLQNVLEWHPGNQTPPNTNFTVQYAIYGDALRRSGRTRLRWRGVRRCRGVPLTRCDLTNHTWDLEHGYYARVRAVGPRGSSDWTVTSPRFEPKSDTDIGPPLVTVAMVESSAIVSITAPMRHQPDKHMPEMSMLEVYPQMTFHLSVRTTGNGKNLTHHIPLSSRRHVYRLVDYDTEYCFSAQARFLSMPPQCQPSAWHCIQTPQDPMIGQVRSVVVGIVVPVLCICVLGVGGYFIHYLVWGKKEKWPNALELPHLLHSLPTFSPEYLDIMVVDARHCKSLRFGISWQPDVHPGGPKQPPACPLPDLLSYAPQGAVVSPEPDAPWERDRESGGVDYGFVGGVPVMVVQDGLEEEEEEEEEEEDESSGRIHCDLESGVLMLPEDPRQAEGGLGFRWMLGSPEPGGEGAGGEEVRETGAEEGRGGGGVRLDSVFVRQGSEQEREAAREMEWETDTLLANWDLVVHM